MKNIDMSEQERIKLLKNKTKELEQEREFYLDLRHTPNKSSSEYRAQESSERTIDKLIKEIKELNNESV